MRKLHLCFLGAPGFAIALLAVFPGSLEARGGKLPRPSRSGVDHIIVVMMENRSFDHFLGWHPTADGRQESLAYTDRDGGTHSTYPLASDYMGCDHPDPDHTWAGGRVEWNKRGHGWLPCRRQQRHLCDRVLR